MTTTTIGPVLYNVWVNGIPYNFSRTGSHIMDATLEQCFGDHDLFTLRIEFPANSKPSTTAIWPENTPISVQWGRSPYLKTWYGYVNDYNWSTEADSGTSNIQLTYQCIGTSAVLNTADLKQWEQASPTWLARRIAQLFSLRSITTPIDFPLEYEVQAGETYFQFLNRMANKCGLRFWCSSGSMYMLSPTSALKGAGSGAVPQYAANKQIGAVDTLRNFQLMQGANLPGSVQSNRVIYGIDPGSGALFSASSQPVNPTSRILVRTSTSVTSYQDAQNRANAWSNLSQFWMGATATVYGNSNLYPGKLVQLTGSAIPQSAIGYWLVSSVRHTMASSMTQAANLDTYLTDVVLLRNQQAGNSVVLSNITPISPEFVTMQLNTTGLWTATNQSPVTVNTT